MTLKLLSYNIQRGGVGRESHLGAVIKEQAPDLVVFQEATRPEIVRRLAEATGMSSVGAAAGRSLGFMSRVPVADYRWARPPWSQHAYLEISPEGTDVRIVGVHLSAIHSAWTEKRRVLELRSLLAAIQPYEQTCHVMIGDFNTLAPDERFDATRLPLRLRLLVWLSGGRIRWQTIAIMLGAHYVDAYRMRHEAENGFTFPTWDPHVRLDYVFVPKSFADRVTACDVVTDDPRIPLASDHFPLCAAIRC